MNTMGPMSPLKARFDQGSIKWTGLHGSSTALTILSAARAHDGIVLVVTRSSHQSHMIEQDVRLFSGGKLPILHFPDHETLPYDPFSPHPDIISERLKTLSVLSTLSKGILLCPVSSLAQKLPPASYILQRSFNLAAGDRLVIEDFRRQLDHAFEKLTTHHGV